jgi:peptidoglycan/xylan/chitin deacetylase (PgdA/CDA1 family)
LNGRSRVSAFLGTLCAVLLLGGVSAASAAQTIVSLGFDDGDATQYQVRSMLASHGMHATFYLNGAKIGGDSYYMTWSQINGIYADGNEIAGHTAYHPDLTQIDPVEAQREVCDDRAQLLGRGFPVSDFAYPYGARNATIESIVANCGYNSARTTDEFGSSCRPCAESIPPADAYATRVVANGAEGLATIESAITKAEQAGGGWAQVVLHQVCNGCSGNAFTPANLTALLDWLKPRAAQGTVVQTVNQVIGGAVQPAVPGPAAPPPPNGTNAIVNPSLELDANADALPDCFMTDSWGNQNFTWTRTTDAHTGTYAERVNVSGYSNGDNKLMPVEDLGQCTPSVFAGRQYRMTVWYKATTPVYFATFSRDTGLAWSYWTSSPAFPATSTWAQASWVTPTIPDGVDGISFGLALAANGSLTVDDVGFDDANPTPVTDDTTPPTSAIACNGTACGSSYYTAPVSVSLSATDGAGGSGVRQIMYTTDGSDPSLSHGSVYSAPFTVSATATVKYRAYDNGLNAEDVHSQPLLVDAAAPTTTIACNGTTCSTGWYTSAVSVSLVAGDGASGSGVSTIVYTTDGTDPTLVNGTPYAGAFTVGATATVKFRAYDNAGNAETIKSRSIQVDSVGPAVSITAPAAGATVSKKATITATAADPGSGVARVSFYADGVLIGTDASAPYSVNWMLAKVTKGQHVLTAVAQDVAGNTTTSSPVTVVVN